MRPGPRPTSRSPRPLRAPASARLGRSPGPGPGLVQPPGTGAEVQEALALAPESGGSEWVGARWLRLQRLLYSNALEPLLGCICTGFWAEAREAEGEERAGFAPPFFCWGKVPWTQMALVFSCIAFEGLFWKLMATLLFCGTCKAVDSATAGKAIAVLFRRGKE